MTNRIDEIFSGFSPDQKLPAQEAELLQELDTVRRRLSAERESHRNSLLMILLCINPFVVGQFFHPSGLWFWAITWLVVIFGYLAIKHQLPDM